MPEEAEAKRKELEKRTLAASYERQKFAAGEDFSSKLAQLYAERQTAIDTNGNVGAVDARIDGLRKYYSTELELIEINNKAKNEAMNLDQSMTARTKAYSQTFEETFIGLADALTNFVMTGKMAFKDLISTMLAELIRFELRAQMSALYKAFRISWGPDSTELSPGINPQERHAKGSIFDSEGIKRFAQGGTFTNSIVASPTLFKFAHGTGLMGEAGPEAIMPLKRDGQGNLGVRSTGYLLLLR